MVHDIFMAASLASYEQRSNSYKTSIEQTQTYTHSLTIILILIFTPHHGVAHLAATQKHTSMQCNSINIMLIKKFASLVRLSLAKMSIEHAHTFSRAQHICVVAVYLFCMFKP